MKVKRRDVLAGGGLALLGGELGFYALSEKDTRNIADTTSDTPDPFGDGNHMPFDVWEEIRDAAIAAALGAFACEVAKNIFFAAAGDSIFPGLEALIGAMGGSSPISCS